MGTILNVKFAIPATNLSLLLSDGDGIYGKDVVRLTLIRVRCLR